jgi:hypothetical protein
MNFEGNIWGAVIAVIVLVNTLVTAWSGRKTRADVAAVHTVINSQLTAERVARNEQESKLVDATQRAARAEGVLEGTGIVTTAKKED